MATKRRKKVDSRRVRQATTETFGHESLRAGQERAMKSLLAGQDVLFVAPTGSGKSLTSQIPGLLLDGPTGGCPPRPCRRARNRPQAAGGGHRPQATQARADYRTLDLGLVADRELLRPAD